MWQFRHLIRHTLSGAPPSPQGEGMIYRVAFATLPQCFPKGKRIMGKARIMRQRRASCCRTAATHHPTAGATPQRCHNVREANASLAEGSIISAKRGITYHLTEGDRNLFLPI